MSRHARIAVLFAVAAASTAGAGCVTRGKYDDLLARKAQTEQLNRVLEEEKTALLERTAVLEEQTAMLGARVKELSVNNAALGDQLTAAESAAAQLQGTYDALVSDLETELATGQVQLEQVRDGIRLNVESEVLFPSGSATLNAKGREVLGKVARELAKQTHTLRIEGHTDNEKIGGALARRYPTNWDLAAARAISVVRLLEENGVAGPRMQAVSLGEFHPVVSNDTATGRAHNRRIEIKMIPAD